MTDTETLREVADHIDLRAQFQSNPTLAADDRARAAAIRGVIARMTELEAQAAARDEAIRSVLTEHQKDHDAPWCRMCGPQGGRFPCSVHAELAPFTNARNKEQS